MSRAAIIACSATKRTDLVGRAPALAIYDGPAWRTYRAYPDCRLWPGYALSAEHGLLGHWEPIVPYDRQLAGYADVRRLVGPVAARLRREDSNEALAGELLVFGGRWYRTLMQHAIAQARLDPARFTFTQGGIGEQLAQLAQFLKGH